MAFNGESGSYPRKSLNARLWIYNDGRRLHCSWKHYDILCQRIRENRALICFSKVFQDPYTLHSFPGIVIDFSFPPFRSNFLESSFTPRQELFLIASALSRLNFNFYEDVELSVRKRSIASSLSVRDEIYELTVAHY